MTSNRGICRVFGQRGWLVREHKTRGVEHKNGRGRKCGKISGFQSSGVREGRFSIAKSRKKVAGLREGGAQGGTLATTEDKGTRALTLGDEMGERVGRGMAVKNGPEWQ